MSQGGDGPRKAPRTLSGGRGVVCRREAIFAAAALVTACLAGCRDASAGASSAPGPSEKKPAATAVTIDLGEVKLRQTRPLENSTLHIHFQAHAVVSGEVAQRVTKLAERHRHQIREQVLTAVRSAESWEFDEPDFHRLRRRIQLRLNQWLDAASVDDIVLTEFRFRVD